MRAGILVAGVATAIPEKSGNRVFAAAKQRLAKYVEGFVHFYRLWEFSMMK
jgi:hypothetical protein